ncbi:hypothetical protein [Aquisalinus flavus]|uniref:Uncharacterized protein n=1 Tax=Aquisalinus flavus TaxID=1526572 RepID=A0A8J2V3K0_9PROT|nr:hypothetical protein [Aquisalinus flavus]MBD0426924.1 hypothetical protein [Aquisalinus flavus]UNE46767.1 hypothetical protein FF099_01155 [Aquisalinus flavus]GGC97012.1 hypothetical protein GCM10011342_02370 [Aquisalinus flavus]
MKPSILSAAAGLAMLAAGGPALAQFGDLPASGKYAVPAADGSSLCAKPGTATLYLSFEGLTATGPNANVDKHENLDGSFGLVLDGGAYRTFEFSIGHAGDGFVQLRGQEFTGTGFTRKDLPTIAYMLIATKSAPAMHTLRFINGASGVENIITAYQYADGSKTAYLEKCG